MFNYNSKYLNAFSFYHDKEHCLEFRLIRSCIFVLWPLWQGFVYIPRQLVDNLSKGDIWGATHRWDGIQSGPHQPPQGTVVLPHPSHYIQQSKVLMLQIHIYEYKYRNGQIQNYKKKPHQTPAAPLRHRSPIKVWVSEKCSKKYSKKHSKNFYLLKKGLKKVNKLFWVLKKVLNNLTFQNVGSKNLLKKGAQKKYYSKK